MDHKINMAPAEGVFDNVSLSSGVVAPTGFSTANNQFGCNIEIQGT